MKMMNIAKVTGKGFAQSLGKLDRQINEIKGLVDAGKVSKSQYRQIKGLRNKYAGTQIVGTGLKAKEKAERVLKKARSA